MLKLVTLSYFLLLLMVVIGADLGLLAPFSAWLHQIPYGDKCCHFLAVGTFSFLVCVTLSCQQAPRSRRWFAVLGVIAILMVLTSMEELSQTRLAHRRFSQMDLICNLAGAMVFGLLSLLVPMRSRPKAVMIR